jgi:hypothetical protein
LSSPPYCSVHQAFTPRTRKTKKKPSRLPHRKLKTRRTLRHSRINGRKPDSPRPTTVKFSAIAAKLDEARLAPTVTRGDAN